MSASSSVDPNNCALDAQGNLKDANEIQFYNSEGDDTPISSTKGKAKAGPSADCKGCVSLTNAIFSVVLTRHSG
jgi:hypothetical protein